MVKEKDWASRGKARCPTVGLLSQSLAHPREVFSPAIRESALSLILAHNHPSGDPTPSQDDKTITQELKGKDICSQEVEPDGIIFKPAGIEGQHITEDADYEGVRVRFRGTLGTAQITMQLDIGFGDVVIPAADSLEYPTILDLPAPKLRCYSKESTIAEKFEAMIKLGALNSRANNHKNGYRNLGKL